MARAAPSRQGLLDQMRRDPAIDEHLAGVNPSSRASFITSEGTSRIRRCKRSPWLSAQRPASRRRVRPGRGGASARSHAARSFAGSPLRWEDLGGGVAAAAARILTQLAGRKLTHPAVESYALRVSLGKAASRCSSLGSTVVGSCGKLPYR